jgi:hypothetical protein
MAKLDGILKIQGTLENLTFYKSADGHMVRTKGGVSKNRIMNDPAFIRTRENGTEFGECAGSGKLFRTAVGTMVFKAKDAKLSSRLLKVMSEIKNRDLVSNRGLRNVAEGITNPEGKLALKGFDFNNNAPMKSVLYAPYTLEATSGKIGIEQLIPAEQLRYPSGATHFSVQSAFANIDFSTGDHAITFSDVVNLPIDLAENTFSLVPSSVPDGSGVQVYLLLIEFFQEVNGIQYSLKNGAFNVLNVLEVV